MATQQSIPQSINQSKLAVVVPVQKQSQNFTPTGLFPMRVGIYGRVSTVEQSALMQLEEMRAFCLRRGWQIVEECIDTGISGSKESRPALNRLLADAKRRKFDCVLVYRYDRFARSLRQL